jgi:hypothetical protein
MDGWQRLPYGHPLGGPQQKVRRAKEHLKLIDGELEVFTSGNVDPAITRSELEPNSEGVYRWLVDYVNEPDLRLAAVVGEFTHNLRSSLDHLTFELSFLDTGGQIPGKSNAFPCCYKRTGNHGWKSPRVQSQKLAGISRKHRAMIYKAQPCYRRKDAPKDPTRARRRRHRHALADLENLWNEDKHRMVMPVIYVPFGVEGVLTSFTDCVETGDLKIGSEFLGKRLKPDAEVYSLPVRVTGPNPHVRMEIKIACGICFPNGLPAIKALSDICAWIEGLLRFFQPEFETPRAMALWDAPRGAWVDRNPIRMRRLTTYRIEPPE